MLICPTNIPGACTVIPIPSDGTHPYAAITDYLNCTFPFDPDQSPIDSLFDDLVRILGRLFSPVTDLKRGLHGYTSSFSLGDSSARLAVGGQSGTVLLSLPGEACALIYDWAPVIRYLRDVRHGRITRWDGAVDDYEGIHTVDYAVDLYLQGKFSAGGNMPSSNQNGSWIRPDGRGRTFYVGRRQNGKMVRVYEKGMQLGGRWHPWVRWEVEMHNRDRVIPWEVLANPGAYFVGCYPNALSWVQDEMSRIRTLQKQVQIGYDALTSYARVAYGSLVTVMLAMEGSAEAVVEKLQRDGIPKRLSHPVFGKGPKFFE